MSDNRVPEDIAALFEARPPLPVGAVIHDVGGARGTVRTDPGGIKRIAVDIEGRNLDGSTWEFWHPAVVRELRVWAAVQQHPGHTLTALSGFAIVEDLDNVVIGASLRWLRDLLMVRSAPTSEGSFIEVWHPGTVVGTVEQHPESIGYRLSREEARELFEAHGLNMAEHGLPDLLARAKGDNLDAFTATGADLDRIAERTAGVHGRRMVPDEDGEHLETDSELRRRIVAQRTPIPSFEDVLIRVSALELPPNGILVIQHPLDTPQDALIRSLRQASAVLEERLGRKPAIMVLPVGFELSVLEVAEVERIDAIEGESTDSRIRVVVEGHPADEGEE